MSTSVASENLKYAPDCFLNSFCGNRLVAPQGAMIDVIDVCAIVGYKILY
jgi:hypothetical protein